jgi:hypothetical protein
MANSEMSDERLALDIRIADAISHLRQRYADAGRSPDDVDWEAVQNTLHIEFDAAFPGDLPANVILIARRIFFGS